MLAVRAFRKACVRCGAAVRGSDLCAACTEFFRVLSAKKADSIAISAERADTRPLPNEMKNWSNRQE